MTQKKKFAPMWVLILLTLWITLANAGSVEDFIDSHRMDFHTLAGTGDGRVEAARRIAEDSQFPVELIHELDDTKEIARFRPLLLALLIYAPNEEVREAARDFVQDSKLLAPDQVTRFLTSHVNDEGEVGARALFALQSFQLPTASSAPAPRKAEPLPARASAIEIIDPRAAIDGGAHTIDFAFVDSAIKLGAVAATDPTSTSFATLVFALETLAPHIGKSPLIQMPTLRELLTHIGLAFDFLGENGQLAILASLVDLIDKRPEELGSLLRATRSDLGADALSNILRRALFSKYPKVRESEIALSLNLLGHRQVDIAFSAVIGLYLAPHFREDDYWRITVLLPHANRAAVNLLVFRAMLFGQGPTSGASGRAERQNAAAVLGLSPATKFEEVYALSRHAAVRRLFQQLWLGSFEPLIPIETARREDLLQYAFGRLSPSARHGYLVERLGFDPFGDLSALRHTGDVIDDGFFPGDMLARAIIHFIAISNEESPGAVEDWELLTKRLIDYAQNGRLLAELKKSPNGLKEAFESALVRLQGKLAADSMAIRRLNELQSSLGKKGHIGVTSECGVALHPLKV